MPGFVHHKTKNVSVVQNVAKDIRPDLGLALDGRGNEADALISVSIYNPGPDEVSLIEETESAHSEIRIPATERRTYSSFSWAGMPWLWQEGAAPIVCRVTPVTSGAIKVA